MGENQSLKKADEWRRLLTVAPIVLWYCWREDDDHIPDTEYPLSGNESVKTTHSRRRKSLYDAILLLCSAVRLLATKTISMHQARAGQEYLSMYCKAMLRLGVDLTPNHHLAMHFEAMIKRLGPVYGWWLFAFERFNGMLEKVKTNGHDGGEAELTMLRQWVQTHLLYELLLALPDDASPYERQMLDSIIKEETSRQRGSMVQEIARLRREASIDGVHLPKRISKYLDLHSLLLSDGSHAYELLFSYSSKLWPQLNLRRRFSPTVGRAFLGDQVARRILYVRKDGVRYGSRANRRTQADIVAFMRVGDTKRVPVQIEDLLIIEMKDSNVAPHVCAVIRRFKEDDTLPALPWCSQ